MSTETASVPRTQQVSPDLKPQELSFPLPKALHTTGHVHLTFLGHCATVFLATSTPGDSGGSVKPLGSFVYAMPDVSLMIMIFAFPIYQTEFPHPQYKVKSITNTTNYLNHFIPSHQRFNPILTSPAQKLKIHNLHNNLHFALKHRVHNSRGQNSRPTNRYARLCGL